MAIFEVVISFQFSTFVSLMQPPRGQVLDYNVVISFQFSTFVSLMQLISHRRLGMSSLRRFIEREKPVVYHRLFLWLEEKNIFVREEVKGRRHCRRLRSAVRREVLHHPKLLVRDRHNDYFTFLGKHTLHPSYMHRCILGTSTVTGVDRVLKHRKAILQQTLSEA